METTAASPFLLLLATSRPAVRSFFESLGFRVGVVSVAPESARDDPAHVARATAAVIDAALDPAAAVALAEELRAQQPELPIAAVICCPHAITPWNLRALLAAGVSGVIDLRARAEDARRALQGIARGESVLQLQLGRGGRSLLDDVFSGRGARTEMQLRLLELVALGLPDREIGERLHLSPHTVKHHIDQLRHDVGVRNRTELAAWAGRHGFYAAEPARAASGRAG
jgi:DNA-binding NarL/FixJ family response regulator